MAAQYIPIKRISSLDTPIKAEKLDGSLFTTENQAHEFIVSVRKNGVKQTVAGGVTGKFIRANGTTIFLQGSISNGDAVVRLHQDCYNVQGRFTFNIFNSQNGVTTCIYSAVGKIDLGSTETVIDAGGVVPDVTDVIAAQETMKQELADAVSRTNSAIAGIQPQIDSSVSGMQSIINSSVSSMQSTINSAVTTMQSRTDTAVQSANDAATAANQAADAANQAAQAGDSKFVRYDAAQGLTDVQRGTARDNIKAATSVGTEPELIAGTAEQLMSDETVKNAEPYKFRKTAGTGNRAYLDKIVGGTVALNQLLTNGDFSDGATGWTAIRSELAVDSGVATVTITQLSSNAYGNRIYVQFKNPKTVMGHKYYVSFVAKTPKTGSISMYASNSNESNIFDVSARAISKANEYASYGFVLNAIRSPEAYTRLHIGVDNSEGNGYAVGDTFNLKNIQLIDLTQMFGSAVADHVYSLEQANAGAGAEWFRNLFPAEYYPYSEGELISVSGLSEHIMRDADSNVIGRYPLDSSLTLRGIPKLDAENNMYYDGDEYTPDGKVNRRYGIVDMGTLEWHKYDNADNTWYFYVNFSKKKSYGNSRIQPLICAEYQTICDGRSYDNTPDMSIYNTTAGENRIAVKDLRYEDTETFKTAMSGVMLVYELATPTEESAKFYTQVQVIDPAGTEEFVSDSIVPVGHETRYMADLKGRLENLPDTVTKDGTYAIKQTDGKMGLTELPFVSSIVETVSGPVASFSDGADGAPMKSLIAYIEPVQDLHGYDHPWPGGGGKNILADTEFNYDIDSANGKITSATGRYARVASGIVPGSRYTVSRSAVGTSTYFYIGFYESVEVGATALSFANIGNLSLGGTYLAPENAVYAVVFFGAGTSTNVMLEKSDSATSFEPYSNICPITGWTAAKVTRTGKNLFDKSNVNLYRGYPDANAGIIKSSSGQCIVWIPCKPNTEYTLQKIAVINGSADRFSVFWTESTPASGTQCYGLKEKHSGFVIGEKYSFSLTTGATAKFIGCWLSRNTEYDESLNTFQIELGSTATDYEPYAGQTYDIDFPTEAGTVYGGTLDVVGGELTVDWEKRVLDGSEAWGAERLDDPNKTFYRVIIGDLGYVVNGAIITDRYEKVSITTSSTDVGISCFNSSARNAAVIYLRPNHDGMSVADFKTWLSDNPVTCVYKLATPITYQLTPQEVKTLLGQNYVFADAGDVNVDYIADTKLYIDKKFTELQALVLENIGG